jgi:hypothetical protein
VKQGVKSHSRVERKMSLSDDMCVKMSFSDDMYRYNVLVSGRYFIISYINTLVIFCIQHIE